MQLDTVDRIARQLARETAQKQEAEHRLESRTRHAEGRSYASATVYGKKLLDAHLAAVAAVIAERLGRISNGQPGPEHRLIAERIAQADPKVLALLTMKVCLDTLGAGKGHERTKPLTYLSVASAVGKADKQN